MLEINYKSIYISMFKHKRGNEGVLYQAPNTRSKLNDEVREELAGRENNLTDAIGLRLSYESPDGLYQNGTRLYIAGTGGGGRWLGDSYDDITKVPFNKTNETQRFKDAKRKIEEEGNIEQIIGHSLGGAITLHLNKDYDNKFKTRVYASPTVSLQKPEDTGQNLRIRGKYDPISVLDQGAITDDKGTVEPFTNHFMDGFKDVGHQESHIPITADDFVS